MLIEVLILIKFLLLILVGILAGILSGLFGLGGGVVVIPILYVILKNSGSVAPAVIMHVAIGTSLAIMLLTTANSIFQHHRAKNILWPLTRKLSPYVFLGVVLGSIISHFLHSNSLRFLFILMLIGLILQGLFKKKEAQICSIETFKFPDHWFSRFYFLLAGFFSVLLGIGGSLFCVSYVRHYGCPMKQASALAISLTPIVSLIGAIGYLFMGLHVHTGLPYSMGYIDWLAFFGVGLGTFFGVPVGVFFSKKLPDQYQAKIYILLLFVFLGLMLI